MSANPNHCPHCGHTLGSEPFRSSKLGVTRRMREAYDAINIFHAGMGRSPSFSELAFMLNLKSKSGVHRLLHSLEERGWIDRRRNHAASVVTREFEEHAR